MFHMNFDILAVNSKHDSIRFPNNYGAGTQNLEQVSDTPEDREKFSKMSEWHVEQHQKKHIAPQHRRFLSRPEIGAGTQVIVLSLSYQSSYVAEPVANSGYKFFPHP